MTIVSNLLIYEKNELKNGLKTVVYEAKSDQDYRKIGFALSNLRSIIENRNQPIIQHKRRIISTSQITDNDSIFLSSFEEPVFKTVRVGNSEDNEIIRLLIGESLATQIRNLPRGIWKVEESQNAVYDALETGKLDEFGEINLYKGFRYSALILEGGILALVIDPKHKFHSRFTLRQKYDKGQIKLERIRHARFTDTCPIDSCTEKNKSFSACRLTQITKTVELIDLEDRKPSDTKLPNTETNIYEYQQFKDVCIKTPKLYEYINDVQPVARVIFWDESPYHYPLERLRESPNLVNLNKEDRLAIMDKIRPLPEIRYRLTDFYVKNISLINVQGMPVLKHGGFFKPQSTGQSITLNRPDLTVGGGRPTKTPYIHLTRFGPADKDSKKFKSLILTVLSTGKIDKKDEQLIKSLFEGNQGRDDIDSFSKTFRISTKVESFIEIGKIEDVDVFLRDMKPENEEEIKGVLLLYTGNTSSNDDIASNLISASIPKQGANLDEIYDSVRRRRRGYFRNLFLQLYTKLGGKPWTLKCKEDETLAILGVSYKIRDNTMKFAVTNFSDSGELRRGLLRSCNDDEFENSWEESFSDLTNGYSSAIVLIQGKCFDFMEKAIINANNNRKIVTNIIEIVDSLPVRLYEVEDSSIAAAPAGTGLNLSINEIALTTTTVSFGTPGPILIRNVFGKPETFRKSVETLFNLTRCYTGYDRFITKLPIPIHSSKTALSEANKYDLDSLEFDKPWYV
ncbi:MAG: hypothetical protein ACFFD4_35455 [Candidatus Odinarchaeota archaeon]